MDCFHHCFSWMCFSLITIIHIMLDKQQHCQDTLVA